SQLTQTRPVLFETFAENGFFTGFTDNYVKVQAIVPEDSRHKIIDMRLDEIGSSALVKATRTVSVVG
ncbi:MAG: tRNA (N(6)-L-threonylcarbamoyladenosine(37)-C(2))-methylthiotransferase MtaB, partial [Saprospiraceae bacterium]|nr:tRNA (N(6)-L-threonylcarbamoyladenosine(37)-C(2))-methylthiotransferase MtaB [Saprospiraceae bacterium]